MSATLVERLAKALLYEGYILYPYRPSVKNRQRWTFGGLYPKKWSEIQEGCDASEMRAECLVEGNKPVVRVSVKFLHLVNRAVAVPPLDEEVGFLESGGKRYEPWQEAVEREVELTEPGVRKFEFPGALTREEVEGGALIRRQEALRCEAELKMEKLEPTLFRVSLKVSNTTEFAGDGENRDEALMRSLASTHAILRATDGEFVSLLEPADKWSEQAKACKNVGVWPVLVGKAGARDTMLASPIILYDYPQLAPESPGDLFDSTEIDEILTLRILTLTDEEKRVAASVDERARRLLERTEALGEKELRNLHGTMRGMGTNELKIGDPVVLRPMGRADAFDILLEGKKATIVSIERDFEDRVHVAVTVDDDPGKDMGLTGQPGHRFFFGVEEVERV